MTLQPSSTVNL